MELWGWGVAFRANGLVAFRAHGRGAAFRTTGLFFGVSGPGAAARGVFRGVHGATRLGTYTAEDTAARDVHGGLRHAGADARGGFRGVHGGSRRASGANKSDSILGQTWSNGFNDANGEMRRCWENENLNIAVVIQAVTWGAS